MAPRFLGKSLHPYPKLPTHPLCTDTFLSTVASGAAYVCVCVYVCIYMRLELCVFNFYTEL